MLTWRGATPNRLMDQRIVNGIGQQLTLKGLQKWTLTPTQT